MSKKAKKNVVQVAETATQTAEQKVPLTVEELKQLSLSMSKAIREANRIRIKGEKEITKLYEKTAPRKSVHRPKKDPSIVAAKKYEKKVDTLTPSYLEALAVIEAHKEKVAKVKSDLGIKDRAPVHRAPLSPEKSRTVKKSAFRLALDRAGWILSETHAVLNDFVVEFFYDGWEMRNAMTETIYVHKQDYGKGAMKLIKDIITPPKK